MYIAIAILIGLVIGFIRGGSIKSIFTHPYNKWWLGLIGVAGELLLHFYCYTDGFEMYEQYLPVVNFISYLLILIMLIFNLDDIYTIIIAIGMTLNFVVTFINGGYLPVSESVMSIMPLYSQMTQSIYTGTNGVYTVMQSTQTLLWFLGVIIPIPIMSSLVVLTGTVAGLSVGDALVLLGLVGLIQRAMTLGVRPREKSPIVLDSGKYPIYDDDLPRFESKTEELFFEDQPLPRDPFDKLFGVSDDGPYETKVLHPIKADGPKGSKAKKKQFPVSDEQTQILKDLQDLTRPIGWDLSNLGEKPDNTGNPTADVRPVVVPESKNNESNGFFVSQFISEKERAQSAQAQAGFADNAYQNSEMGTVFIAEERISEMYPPKEQGEAGPQSAVEPTLEQGQSGSAQPQNSAARSDEDALAVGGEPAPKESESQPGDIETTFVVPEENIIIPESPFEVPSLIIDEDTMGSVLEALNADSTTDDQIVGEELQEGAGFDEAAASDSVGLLEANPPEGQTAERGEEADQTAPAGQAHSPEADEAIGESPGSEPVIEEEPSGNAINGEWNITDDLEAADLTGDLESESREDLADRLEEWTRLEVPEEPPEIVISKEGLAPGEIIPPESTKLWEFSPMELNWDELITGDFIPEPPEEPAAQTRLKESGEQDSGVGGPQAAEDGTESEIMAEASDDVEVYIPEEQVLLQGQASSSGSPEPESQSGSVTSTGEETYEYFNDRAIKEQGEMERSEKEMMDIWSQVAEENREMKLGRRRSASANYQTDNPYKEEAERKQAAMRAQQEAEQRQKEEQAKARLQKNRSHQDEAAQAVNSQSHTDLESMSVEERLAAGYEKVAFEVSGKRISFWRKKKS